MDHAAGLTRCTVLRHGMVLYSELSTLLYVVCFLRRMPWRNASSIGALDTPSLVLMRSCTFLLF